MAYSIATYADLQARISSRAGGSSDTGFAAAIQEAIFLAEQQMNMRLRVPEMMVRSRETVNEKWESLPPDCLELRGAWRVDDPDTDDRDFPLKTATPERIAWYGERLRGPPVAICIVGGQYRIEPRATPGTEYQVRLLYYGKVPDLTVEGPCTIILNRYPLLYLWGALANLGDWLTGDDRLPTWEAKFREEIAVANAAANRRARSYAA